MHAPPPSTYLADVAPGGTSPSPHRHLMEEPSPCTSPALRCCWGHFPLIPQHLMEEPSAVLPLPSAAAAAGRTFPLRGK